VAAVSNPADQFRSPLQKLYTTPKIMTLLGATCVPCVDALSPIWRHESFGFFEETKAKLFLRCSTNSSDRATRAISLADAGHQN
jgi:hypothetical protein